MKKTLAAALTVAVIGASAMFATTSNSQAGYYGGGYYGGYNQSYYGGHCYWKKIRVWGHYGYHWKTIRVCH